MDISVLVIYPSTYFIKNEADIFESTYLKSCQKIDIFENAYLKSCHTPRKTEDVKVRMR